MINFLVSPAWIIQLNNHIWYVHWSCCLSTGMSNTVQLQRGVGNSTSNESRWQVLMKIIERRRAQHSISKCIQLHHHTDHERKIYRRDVVNIKKKIRKHIFCVKHRFTLDSSAYSQLKPPIWHSITPREAVRHKCFICSIWILVGDAMPENWEDNPITTDMTLHREIITSWFTVPSGRGIGKWNLVLQNFAR